MSRICSIIVFVTLWFGLSSFTTTNISLDKGYNEIVLDTTALSIAFKYSNEIENVKLLLANDTIPFEKDEHGSYTKPYFFEKAESRLTLFSARAINLELVILLHHESGLSNLRVANTNEDYCEESPYAIPQSVWRKGLDEPVPGRVKTPTEHIVIHHAAGSNTNTNYTDVVRSYYELHTKGNGWDDIGYNYLIAQNGDIYTGRDPLGEAEQDNVRGAHYCGNNSNTMGICMLGNYMDVAPTDAAISSLCNLLAWKVIKEDFDVYGEQVHQSNGVLTPRILGHRFACSTQCPGDVLWGLVDEIRDSVQWRVDKCEGIVNPPDTSNTTEEPEIVDYNVLYNPAKYAFYIKSKNDIDNIRLFDLNGVERSVNINYITDELIELTTSVKGILILEFEIGNRAFREPVFVTN